MKLTTDRVQVHYLQYSDHIHLVAIAVPEHLRGKGLAKRKIEALKRLARIQRKRITGNTLPSKVGFWKRMGFKVYGNMKLSYRPPRIPRRSPRPQPVRSRTEEACLAT